MDDSILASSLRVLFYETGIAFGAVTGTLVVMLFSTDFQAWFDSRQGLFNGYRGRCLRSLKRPGRQAGLKPLSNAEVMHEWGNSSVPSGAFMACTRTTLLA